MKIGTLKAEPKTEWKETELDDLSVKVTGLKTKEFRRRLEVLLGRSEIAKQLKAGGAKESAARDTCFNKAISELVLHDWANLTEDDGTEIPFDRVYALQLLTESLPFRDAVVLAAQEVDNDRYAKEEDVLGNSASTSVGG